MSKLTTIIFRFDPATPLADQHRHVQILKGKYAMTGAAGVANAYLPIQPDTLFTIMLGDHVDTSEAEAEIRAIAGVDQVSVVVVPVEK